MPLTTDKKPYFLFHGKAGFNEVDGQKYLEFSNDIATVRIPVSEFPVYTETIEDVEGNLVFAPAN